MLVSGQFNLLSSGTSELIDQLLAQAILERMRWTLKPITVPEKLRVPAIAARKTIERSLFSK
jgi:hypothetical protein